jgi:hypothetical protein
LQSFYEQFEFVDENLHSLLYFGIFVKGILIKLISTKPLQYERWTGRIKEACHHILHKRIKYME